MARGGRSSGVNRLAQSIRHGLDAPLPHEAQGYSDGAQEGADTSEADPTQSFMLEHLVQWDGNIAELFQDSEAGKRKLGEIGALVIREYQLDDKARSGWTESAENALSAAGQKKGEKKTYPFTNAANVKYPLLTTAAMQFNARALPNIVRGDEVVQVKINGDDSDSQKSERAQRVADYCNDQIIYQCPEWETGTDALLLHLPIVGAGFRKIYWDNGLKRPRFDYASALKVVIPVDAPSLEMSPRVTHVLDIYPHDYEYKVASGIWLKCDIQTNTEDSQKPIVFLEQCRYIDMDEDGLSEPYIVVVHKDSGQVVRIDPAFDQEDIKRYPANDGDNTLGKIYCIERLLPWVEYTFLPDPEGGAYGIGFGKLLEAISETINTLLNQMIDAGHLSNTNTGFIGAGFKTRGGTITLEPNMFKVLEGVQDLKQAIQRLDFPGPSAVSFNLVEMLLGAAKDITAIKDVLSGDMPGGEHVAQGTVLALIEQGLQVFTSIYKRIYRSMRKEFEIQCRLNQRYLDPADYQKFLDQRPPPPMAPPPQDPAAAAGAQPPPPIGHNGGPPLMPADMGAGAPPDAMQPPMAPDAGSAPMDMGAMPQGAPPMPPQGQPPQTGAVVPFPGQGQPAPQQMGQEPNPKADFDLSDLDIRPVADPTAITDMQRMAKAQFKLGFLNDPAINRIKVIESVWRDARIADVDQYIVQQNPIVAQQTQLELAQKQATINDTQADADLKKAQTAEILGQTPPKQVAPPQIDPAKQAELDQKSRELDQQDARIALDKDKHLLEQFRIDMEAADREAELIYKAADQRHEHAMGHGDLHLKREVAKERNDAMLKARQNGAGAS